MARHDVARQAAAQDDDAFMDLFNDKDMTFDDMVDAMDENDGASDPQQTTTRNPTSAISQEMLGIDEEVTIKKVRKPVVKLDESRLTSAAGIPKLQKIAKTKMKFRGKGHEFSDVAKLLRTYQLWLHDLYPRAKFNDGLIILEKLGHTKSVQRLRCDWVNQSKPGAVEEPESDNSENNEGSAQAHEAENHVERGKSRESSSQEATAGSLVNDLNNNEPEQTQDQPDDDELDALLAEEPDIPTDQQSTILNNDQPQKSHDEFSREEDIMRELEMWDD